jgi:hypothetical protein
LKFLTSTVAYNKLNEMTNTRNRSEEVEQAKLIKWSHQANVRKVLPQLKWLFHVPNGGQRTAFAGAQMKALGVKKGVPDLILPITTFDHMGVKHCGLIVEMKSATGSLSIEQKEWKEHFLEQLWEFRLARTASEARSYLCQYLSTPQNLVPEIE